MEHDEENSCKGNDKQSDNHHGENCDVAMRMTQIQLKIHFSLQKSIYQLIY